MFLTIVLLFFSSHFGYANDLDPYDISDAAINYENADQDMAKAQKEELALYEKYQPKENRFVNTGFMFFPFYKKVDLESTAVGVDAMYYFRREKDPPLSNPSYLRGSALAGQKDYADIMTSFNNYWDNEFNNLYLSIEAERRLIYFYEPLVQNPSFVGNIRSTNATFNALYRQKIWKSSYVGVKYALQSYDMYDASTGFYFNPNIIAGLNTGHSSGLGVIFGNIDPGGFSSLKSLDFEISNMFYLGYLGSCYDYGVHKVDLTERVFINKVNIFVFKFYGRFMTGNPPYSDLSSVGEMFRAYSIDKYRDKHFIGFNMEYRTLLISVLTIRGLFGFGYHASSFDNFKINEILPCYGVGLSFVLNRELGINAGFEYLVGKGSKGMLFGVGEKY